MASMTRRRIPPENWWRGSRRRVHEGSEMPHLVEQLDGPPPRGVTPRRAVGADGLDDLPAHRVLRVQAGERVLEDHGDARAADPPHGRAGQAQQIDVVVTGLIRRRGHRGPVAAGRGWTPTCPSRTRRRRRPFRPRRLLQRHPAYGVGVAIVGRYDHRQVVDGEEGVVHAPSRSRQAATATVNLYGGWRGASSNAISNERTRCAHRSSPDGSDRAGRRGLATMGAQTVTATSWMVMKAPRRCTPSVRRGTRSVVSGTMANERHGAGSHPRRHEGVLGLVRPLLSRPRRASWMTSCARDSSSSPTPTGTRAAAAH